MAEPIPRKPSELTDLQLIDALNRSDERAFETLYLRHREWVWRVALRYLGDEAEAWDIVQVVFLDFLKRFPGFRLTSRLTTYLYPVTRHFAFAAARKRNRSQPGKLEEDAACAAVDRCTPDSHERLQALNAALALLPEMHSEVLLMRFVDDMSMDEIGTALGIPSGTVKSRLHHALAALRADSRAIAYFYNSELNT